jgi:hypothetical protein
MSENEFIEALESVNWEGKKLPKGLVVYDGLYLRGTAAKSLPDNLTIKKRGGFRIPSLDLICSDIKKLPSGLVVEGNLYISDTKIDEIPLDAVITGYISFKFTPLEQKYKEVGLL